MDFFSKFKKTDDQVNPTSVDQEPDSSSYATETTAATDNYSSGDVIKGAYASDENEKTGSYGDDKTEGYSDKPTGGGVGGGYGDDTEEGYSKKPSYGGATTGTDDYEQHKGGYGEDKPSYGGATTETDGYQKPEGGYGEDTEEGFSKKPTYGGSTDGTDEYGKPEAKYGEDSAEDFSEKKSGTETDNYGKYKSTEDFSYTPSGDDSATGVDSGEAYGADATKSYIKKPTGGYGAATGDYASGDKYNE